MTDYKDIFLNLWLARFQASPSKTSCGQTPKRATMSRPLKLAAMESHNSTLLTLAEVAKFLRVKYARASDLARQDIIPVVRLGRQVRVDQRALEAFIAGGGKALPGGWRRDERP